MSIVDLEALVRYVDQNVEARLKSRLENKIDLDLALSLMPRLEFRKGFMVADHIQVELKIDVDVKRWMAKQQKQIVAATLAQIPPIGAGRKA